MRHFLQAEWAYKYLSEASLDRMNKRQTQSEETNSEGLASIFFTSGREVSCASDLASGIFASSHIYLLFCMFCLFLQTAFAKLEKQTNNKLVAQQKFLLQTNSTSILD